MACVLTQGLLLDCRDSFGGLKAVHIMEYDNATTITQTTGVVSLITKATGKRFYKYNLIAHTGEGDESLSPSRDNGTVPNKQSVKFPINKMTVAVRNEILLLAQNRLLIVLEDENGCAWLYGKDYGLMLGASTAKTGKMLGDRNGYELHFDGDEKYLAPQVDAATLATLETPGT